jgi:hypothetical protein
MLVVLPVIESAANCDQLPAAFLFGRFNKTSIEAAPLQSDAAQANPFTRSFAPNLLLTPSERTTY